MLCNHGTFASNEAQGNLATLCLSLIDLPHTDSFVAF